MKKTLLITALFLVICTKEVEDCNCGWIKSDNAQDYSITIENNCTGNVETFQLNPSDWIHAQPNHEYCLTNVDSW
jgi:hypothetical protein